MFLDVINHSPDLKKLQESDFKMDFKNGFLIVSNIPYLGSTKEPKYGILITELTLDGLKAGVPKDHTISFIGEHPCDINGIKMKGIVNNSNQRNLGSSIIVDHLFSMKPGRPYTDYYEKILTYSDVISNPVRSLFPQFSGDFLKETYEDSSIFNYADTNSSRAEIGELNDKFTASKIGIIGLGGTGSYILDYISKTPVKEIHIIDGDIFSNHNAFRAPGAASIEELNSGLSKVEYLNKIYSRMHKGIKVIPDYITEKNMHFLKDLTFVFISIDKGSIKKSIFNYLESQGVSFIDVGIGVQNINGALLGLIKTTYSSEELRDHIYKNGRVSFSDINDDDYESNIQIAELNAMSAALAVMRWKRSLLFYHSQDNEFHNVFSINSNQSTNDDVQE